MSLRSSAKTEANDEAQQSLNHVLKPIPRPSRHLFLYLLLLTTVLTQSYKMPYISLDSTRPCSSAGRITARLLFSFLALSPLSVVAASPDPVPPPLRATALPDNIFGPGPAIGGGSGERGTSRGEGGHTFVGVPKLHRITQSL